MRINVSLTSIFDNQAQLQKCLKSLLNQTLKADAIYLYLSNEPYLLDKGFSEIPRWLESFPVIVKFVPNSGPFRKLLPLLKDKWNSDELIITVDDDTDYSPDLIEKMVAKYNETGCCIACRAFFLEDRQKYSLGAYKVNSVYNFHTGKGGVLYHPSMFRRKKHPHCDGVLSNDYLFLCKTADDIWFNLWRIYNEVPCVVLQKYNYMVGDNTNKNFALFNVYNESKNKQQFCNTHDFIFS